MARRPPPLAGLRFSVVGAGRVGSSLAAWLVAAGGELVAVGGRPGSRSAATLARSCGGATRPVADLVTTGQDLLLIAVSDTALDSVAGELDGRGHAEVVLHTSGSRDATVLGALRAGGSAVGSLHPLKAFPTPLPEPAEAPGTIFGIDGDPEALALAERLAHAVGGRTAEVPPRARLLYHLGASLAAGGVLTLLAATEELASRLDLPRAIVEGYLTLAAGAAAHAEPLRPLAEALTGPLARGETATFEAQLGALESVYADLVPLVRRLALETLARCAGLRPLTPDQESLKRRLEADLEAIRPS